MIVTQSSSTSGWQLLWHLIQYAPKLYAIDSFLWILIMSLPAVPGLIIYEFFNTLTGSSQLGFSLWVLIVLLLVIAISEIIVQFAGRLTKGQHRFTISSLLQRNLLQHIFDCPGAEAIMVKDGSGRTRSPGEVISYFRDDISQIEDNVASISELIGLGVFTFGSVAILLSINIQFTLFVFAPLIGVVTIVQRAQNRIKQYRRASRQATERVTGLMNEIFSTVQAIKVAGAETEILHHFQELNDQRRQTMLNDRLLTTILDSVFENMVSLGTGLILLFAALLLQSGSDRLTVGDFALFVYYLPFITTFLSFFGQFIALYQHTNVSFERMADLLKGKPMASLVAHHALYLPDLLGQKPALPAIPQSSLDDKKSFQELRVCNLTFHYPDTHSGIQNINLVLCRSSLTAIVGRIGAGKTTLLRTLLGLLPMQTGAVYWNDHQITDPANFFIPPHSAYTPQIPQLFSYTLRENILLGLEKDDQQLAEAIQLAVFERDVAAMPERLETVVGSKGVRLSGGQLQRTAASRMLIRQPELLVFDDLSSALDVNTEKRLWQRLFAIRNCATIENTTAWTPTFLVVSHRHQVLQQADQIVVLKAGRVEAVGKLTELLETCVEMQQLWQGEVTQR
jgi:ATP-binding cassette, subfamily B, bacterial